MENMSIYKQITYMIEEYPGLPYVFQNVEVAGRLDTYYALWRDDIPPEQKWNFTEKLIELLKGSMEEGTITQELRDWLGNNPVVLYFIKLNFRLKIFLAEDHLDGEQLYPLGIELATKGKSLEEVKLGIMILGFFENDLTRQIIRTLGLHSEFTIYALESSKNFSKHNSFTFELAKDTRGYGKLAAIALLNPITEEQRDWFFNYAIQNEAAPNMSAVIAFEKEDMGPYYRQHEMTEESFSKFSRMLAYAGESGDIKDFAPSLVVITNYLKSFPDYGKSFIDLAAVTMIKGSMAPYWEKDGEDLIKVNGWTSDIEDVIRNQCIEILEESRWLHVVFEELASPKEETSLILGVLDEIGLIPDIGELTPLLERDLLDLNVMEYTLVEYPSEYLDAMYIYLDHILPDEVFTDEPLDMEGRIITPEFKADIWLAHLLKAMVGQGKNDEVFFIKCLTCRFPDARVEAIKALQYFRGYWSEDVYPALEEALEKEPVNNIRKRLHRLLRKTEDKGEKEQRYIDIGHLDIEPSPLDIHIGDTVIAGTFYRDMMVVEGQIEEGDMLYLIREPDNLYDDMAIMVTAEDGYVLGYIPRKDNPTLAAMLDAGEKLYAFFGGDDIARGRPGIKVMLNITIEKGGKIVPFPGLQKNKFHG